MRSYRWPSLASARAMCAFWGWLGREEGMILSTVPGTLVLDCPGVRLVSKFSSAILADLATHGFAISFVMLTRNVLLDWFLVFVWSMQS
jgi:hypothetical protein